MAEICLILYVVIALLVTGRMGWLSNGNVKSDDLLPGALWPLMVAFDIGVRLEQRFGR